MTRYIKNASEYAILVFSAKAFENKTEPSAGDVPANELRHDVPAGLLPVLDRCLQKERDRRYSSAVELYGELAALG